MVEGISCESRTNVVEMRVDVMAFERRQSEGYIVQLLSFGWIKPMLLEMLDGELDKVRIGRWKADVAEDLGVKTFGK